MILPCLKGWRKVIVAAMLVATFALGAFGGWGVEILRVYAQLAAVIFGGFGVVSVADRFATAKRDQER